MQTDSNRAGLAFLVVFIALMLQISTCLAEETITIPPPELKSITFAVDKETGEQVIFTLNGYYPPTVFGIEGPEPRVVCDFPKTHIAMDARESLEINGANITRVRTGIHSEPERKIRAVLDLVPDRNYDIHQVFVKQDNQFIISVKLLDAEKPAEPDTAPVVAPTEP